MARLDRNGVLCDYTIRQVMAFDSDPSTRATAVKPVTVEEGLQIAEDQRKAAEQSPLGKLIPGYYRLP